MNVQETLFYIRKNKKLPQRKLLKHIDASVYSKIESGKKNLKFSELLEILNNISIPLGEFSKYLDNETTGKKIRTLLKHYKQDPESTSIRKEICMYFNTLNFTPDMPLEELSNYVGIKILFSEKWEEIPKLSQNELAQIFDLLSEKIYYFHYDYAILSNTIYLFDDEQIDSLMQKAFPVKDMPYRNAATKEFITNLVCNLITTFLRVKKYEKCVYYIELGKKEKENYDLPYKIMIHFLEHLVHYIQTKNTQSKNALETSINFLHSVGEHDLATALQVELEYALSIREKPLIILRNHFNQQN